MDAESVDHLSHMGGISLSEDSGNSKRQRVNNLHGSHYTWTLNSDSFGAERYLGSRRNGDGSDNQAN